MDAVFLAAGAALGGLAFRIRGGLLSDRWRVCGQAQRLVYAALMAAVTLGAGWPWPLNSWRLPAFAAGLLGAWFLGAVYAGTFGSIDSGRNEGSRARDFLMNTLRGVLYALPAAALVAGVAVACGEPRRAWAAGLMLLGGAWQGMAYDLAWTLRPPPRHAPTEWAEVATGACLGLGAAAAGVLAS